MTASAAWTHRTQKHPYIEAEEMEQPEPDEIRPEPSQIKHDAIEPPPPLPAAAGLPDGP
jgi:hypothetical protein